MKYLTTCLNVNQSKPVESVQSEVKSKELEK